MMVREASGGVLGCHEMVLPRAPQDSRRVASSRRWWTAPWLLNMELNQSASIAGTARRDQSGHRELNGRESIQIGVPGRVMLILMRVICAHAEAVEMKVGGVGI
jgi:hypothetical protein